MESVLQSYDIASTHLNKSFTYRILKAKKTLSDEVDLLLVHDGDDYLEIGKLQETYNHHLEKGLGKNTCFVLLPPGSSEDRWHYYHSDGNFHKAYQRFIYDELLPELQTSMKAAKLGMLGDSLAGAVSLRIAMENPGIWSHLLLQSAAFSKEDMKLSKSLVRKLPWTVYQSVGTQENEFISPITQKCLYILTRNRQIRHTLWPENYVYAENDHGHLWECWREDLSSAIEIFYQY